MNKWTKRVLSVLLACVLIGGALPTLAVLPQAKAGGNRYTVLLLDTVSQYDLLYEGSVIYTVPTSISTTKQAAQRFTDQIFMDSSGITNHVAIVSFGSSASIESNFSTSKSALTSVISGLSETKYGSNLNSALVTAESLLDGITDANTIKNVVMFLPEAPSYGAYTTTGKYSDSDCDWINTGTRIKLYAYANTAYATSERLKGKYNLYSIGLFTNFANVPTLGQPYVAFSKQVVQDLQNKGYYDVQDPNDLEFAFGDVADDIINDNDPDKNCPVIVIPGAMCSRLFSTNIPSEQNDDTQIWPPEDGLAHPSRITRLNDYLKMSEPLFTPSFNVDQRYTSKQEYGAQNTYKNLVKRLVQEFPNKPIYVFSYDWRQSNEDTARALMAFINGNLKADKIDLVCHSMGGIVASSYVAQYGSGKIRQLVTCGTPYEGAPKLINVVQNWDVVGKPFDDFMLGFFGGLRKSLKKSFPSVTQLVPTTQYVERIEMLRDSWIPFWGDYELTTEQYQNCMRGIFGTKNYNNALSFQNSIRSKGNNILLGLPNAHFIIGKDKPTISAVKFKSIGNGICDDFQYDWGDGTVPYQSASMLEQVKGIPASRRLELSNTNHQQTVSTNEALTGICNVLRTGDFQLTSSPNSNKKYIVMRFACPIEVNVTRSGEALSSNANNLSVLSSFGCLDFLGENDDIKMVCVEENNAYAINLQGTDSGTMDYEIRWFDENNNLADKKTFSNVAITENTKISTDTDKAKGIVLNVDENGDGVFDKVINPDITSKFVRIFNWQTKYPSTFINWFLFIVCFGWIWMWFI